jgi:hypothetical protein
VNVMNPTRILPFLIQDDRGAFTLSTMEANPYIIGVEIDFTPRAIDFLLEKGVIL